MNYIYCSFASAIEMFGISCARLYCDIQHILGCIRSLPSVNFGESGPPNWGQLDEFLVQNFGTEASE